MSIEPACTNDTTFPSPPRWAEALMGVLVPRENKESITGDLLEEYRRAVVPSRGRVRADLWYGVQVARALWALTAVFWVTAVAMGVGSPYLAFIRSRVSQSPKL